MSSAAMLLPAVAALLDRDLQALRREVEAYPEDGDLWKALPGLPNTGGTLVLHLTGNLQHYFGARLGKTGYVRNRDAEFSRRDVSRPELLREIESARAAVRAAADLTNPAMLDADFPESIAGSKVRTGEYLVHLATHFAYHLGQVDYHRRIVTGSSAGIDAMRPTALPSSRPAERSSGS